MAGFLPPVLMEVVVNAQQAMVSLTELNGKLTELGAKAEATGVKLSGMERAATAASGAFKVMAVAAAAFAVFAVDAAVKSEAAYARLDVALKNTGNGSKATSEEMKKVSEANTKMGFTTEATAGALGTLVTATGNVTDSTKLLNTAMDLARYKHISLEEAATTLARGTQGSAKAFKEMGITLDTHLPKQQAINKAMDELNAKLSGQSQAYLKTFGGQLQQLSAQFQLTAEKVGQYLIPILEKLMGFIERNGKAILIVLGVVGAVIVAIKAWELATKAMAVAQGILNAVMDANPISLIILAIGALIAIFVVAWNHIKIFRDVVVDVAQAVVGYIAFMIRAWGGLIEIIVKVVTGPMRLFLGALSHLPGIGKYAKSALDFINSGIKGIGDVADSVANKVDGFGKSLNALRNAKISFGGGGGGSNDPSTTPDTTPFNLKNYTGGGGGAATQAATALKKQQAEVNKIYAEMKTDIDAAKKAISDATDAQNQRDLAAQQTYDDTMFQANRTYNDDLYKLNRDSKDRIDKLNRAYDEAMLAAQKTYDDAKLQEEQKNADAILQIHQTYEDAITTATQQAADKRQSIIQKSIDLLTNAFQSATGIDVGSLFASLLPKDNTAITNALFNQVKNGVGLSVSWWGQEQNTGISGLLDSLKTKLAGAKQLADDAAKLAAMGYSQTFVQQVVSQGSEVGDQMAQAIFNATPESQAQLKDLYEQLQTTSETGVTKLATQMSTGTSLATTALTQEYAQVQTDLDKALADASASMQTSLTAQSKSFNDALAGLSKTLSDAQVSAKKTLDNGLADEATSYKNSLEDMNTTLKNATDDADATLKQALASSLSQFNADVDKINTDMLAKLATLQTQLKTTADQIKALAGTTAGVGVMAGSPAAPYLAGTTPSTPSGTYQSNGADRAGGQAPLIVQNINNSGTDTSQLTAATLAALKLGTTLAGTSVKGN